MLPSSISSEKPGRERSAYGDPNPVRKKTPRPSDVRDSYGTGCGSVVGPLPYAGVDRIRFEGSLSAPPGSTPNGTPLADTSVWKVFTPVYLNRSGRHKTVPRGRGAFIEDSGR
jgi:hypothetical protein